MRRAWLGVAAAILCGPGLGAAQAQTADCNGLYAAIQAADDAGRAGGTWGRAAAQQRGEIDRTQRYADQLGCDGGGLFDNAPPQCGAVLDRLQRMEDNLASIQAQARDHATDQGGRRAALVARYNAACVGGNPGDLAQRGDRGLLGFLFGGGRNPADAPNPDDLSSVPLNGDIMDGTGEGGRSRGQAVCVRTCDGGWFPLAPHAGEDQLDGLEQLCEASCPNTEARLYTMARGDDLSAATAVDGSPYTALPAAFRFEKTFTPTCTCKPPNQSWTDALAEAEKLLGQTDRHDIVVTAALSDQMAKPGAAPVAKGKSGKASKKVAVGSSLPAPAPAPVGPDQSVTRDAERAQQAPTASNDTTGIGGPVRPARVVREGDGPTIAVAGPDGVKKRVRLIVP